jgi:hypothetical protein
MYGTHPVPFSTSWSMVRKLFWLRTQPMRTENRKNIQDRRNTLTHIIKNIKSTATMMSCGLFSTDTVSKSTAPWSFTMHATNEEKLSPSQTWDIVIDYGNSTVDLSNLVYSRRSLLSGKVRSLYPSKSEVNILQDLNNASYIFAKSRMNQQFRPRGQHLPRQDSISRCRSKMAQDSNTTYFVLPTPSLGRCASFKRNSPTYSSNEAHQDNELLPPDAPDSDGTLTDIYKRPPAYDEYTTPNSIIEIEIAPGVFVPLRDGQETGNAIREGNCVHVHCFCCAAKLFCISDAQYVLCPDCNVVSPLDLPGKCDGRGVGLGLLAD